MFNNVNPALAVAVLNSLVNDAERNLDAGMKGLILKALLTALALPEFRGPNAHQGMGSLTGAEAREVLAGRKIQAIKLVRERTGLGLRESKDLVDGWEDASGARRLSPPAF